MKVEMIAAVAVVVLVEVAVVAKAPPLDLQHLVAPPLGLLVVVDIVVATACVVYYA